MYVAFVAGRGIREFCSRFLSVVHLTPALSSLNHLTPALSSRRGSAPIGVYYEILWCFAGKFFRLVNVAETLKFVTNRGVGVPPLGG
jgi:hypothetical protein